MIIDSKRFKEIASRGVSQKTWDAMKDIEREEYLKANPTSRYADPNRTLPTQIKDPRTEEPAIERNGRKRYSIRQVLNGHKLGADSEDLNLWYDCFCSFKALKNRGKRLMGALNSIKDSPYIDLDKDTVFFKNNSIPNEGLYDSFSICDGETGEVKYFIVPDYFGKGAQIMNFNPNDDRDSLESDDDVSYSWNDIKDYLCPNRIETRELQKSDDFINNLPSLKSLSFKDLTTFYNKLPSATKERLSKNSIFYDMLLKIKHSKFKDPSSVNYDIRPDFCYYKDINERTKGIDAFCKDFKEFMDITKLNSASINTFTAMDLNLFDLQAIHSRLLDKYNMNIDLDNRNVSITRK